MTQKIKRKESKDTTRENRQITKEEQEKKGITEQPENNKLAVSPYIAITTLNGLNSMVKRQSSRMDKKTVSNYMLPIRDSLSFKDTY